MAPRLPRTMARTLTAAAFTLAATTAFAQTEFIANSFYAAGAPFSKYGYIKWAKIVEEMSGGELKPEVYTGTVLLAPRASLQGVRDGVVQVAHHAAVYTPSELPVANSVQELGFNYRLTDIQAALGAAQLGRADPWRTRRAILSARYDAALADLPGLRRAQRVPRAPAAAADRDVATPPGDVPPVAWHLHAVRTERRRELYDHLRSEGVGAQVHYLPVHLHPYYRQRLGTRPGEHPVAEAYYAEALSLPLYPGLDEADQDRVIGLVREFHHGG